MSNERSSSASGGIGFAGALTLLFIGLKLGGVLDWSWLWVLSPLWISAALAVLIVVLFLAGAALVAAWPSRRR